MKKPMSAKTKFLFGKKCTGHDRRLLLSPSVRLKPGKAKSRYCTTEFQQIQLQLTFLTALKIISEKGHSALKNSHKPPPFKWFLYMIWTLDENTGSQSPKTQKSVCGLQRMHGQDRQELGWTVFAQHWGFHILHTLAANSTRNPRGL